MKKLDRRIARTRKALGDAIIDLALEKNYDQITVRDLTHYANVGYATFYRHFKSKDALLSYVLQSALEDLKNLVSQEDTVYDEALASYKYFSQNTRLLRVYVDLPRSNVARQLIRKELAELVVERYKERDSTGIPLEVSVIHIIESAHELLRWYLHNIEKYSLEEVAVIYADLILGATESTALVPREEWLRENPTHQYNKPINANEAPPRPAN